MRLFLVLILLFGIVFVGCRAKSTIINGEMFVVTQGAGNYKLGLVEVRAIPEDAMVPFLESKKPAYQTAQKEMENAEGCDSKYVPDCGSRFIHASDQRNYLYFENRPANWAAEAHTDSDGKFKMTLPKPGKYALMASAQRSTGDVIDERYYWIVWVNADGTPRSVTLSNDNKLAMLSPDQMLAIR